MIGCLPVMCFLDNKRKITAATQLCNMFLDVYSRIFSCIDIDYLKYNKSGTDLFTLILSLYKI